MDHKFKTELCKNIQYLNTGKCSYGKKCKFAHGFEELRLRKDIKCYNVINRDKKINSLNNINLNRIVNYIFN